MKPWVRWTVLGTSAVVVVALFVALRPGPTSDDASPTPTTTTSPTPPTSGSPATSSPTASPGPQAVEIEVEIEEGRVEGPARPTIAQGELVLLVVKADVRDEIHIHGYDLSAEVGPDRTARIRFRADVAGVFEVELEEAGRLLLELEIVP